MVDYSDRELTKLDSSGKPYQQQPQRKSREVEIILQIGRHINALFLLWAELQLGYKPAQLDRKEDKK